MPGDYTAPLTRRTALRVPTEVVAIGRRMCFFSAQSCVRPLVTTMALGAADRKRMDGDENPRHWPPRNKPEPAKSISVGTLRPVAG